MEPIITAIVTLVVGAGIPGLLLLYFAINPEKFEVWLSILYKGLSRLGIFQAKLQKRYVKYDLQGRVNTFVKSVSDSAPYLENSGVVVEWVDVQQDKKSFLENGKVILRLSKNDPNDINFVHGAYWAVAAKLLPRVKTYIAPYQRQALDLYVTSNIIKHEKINVIQHFLDLYLHPQISNGNEKIQSLYDKFDQIDKYGVFYPIFLQELYFLSLMVFGKPSNQQIIEEVSALADFLTSVADRQVNQDTRLNFQREFCKFAIVIVGKGEKMSEAGTEPYLRYIKAALIPAQIHTIYLVGRADYKEFISEVAKDLYLDFEIYKSHQYSAQVRVANGAKRADETCLIVLRSLDIPIYAGTSK